MIAFCGSQIASREHTCIHTSFCQLGPNILNRKLWYIEETGYLLPRKRVPRTKLREVTGFVHLKTDQESVTLALPLPLPIKPRSLETAIGNSVTTQESALDEPSFQYVLQIPGWDHR